MNAKNNTYMALLAIAAIGLTLSSANAQLNGAFGLDMGGDSSTGRLTGAETITDISTYGVGVFPQGWRTPNLDIANMIVPVSQFTGVNNNGTNVATLDLIPLRTTSFQLVDPVTNVITSLDGKNLYNSDGTLTGPRSVALGSSNLLFSQGTGQIGVNTTTPIAHLHVHGDSTSATGTALVVSGLGARISLIDTTSASVSTAPDWFLQNSGGGLSINKQQDINTGGFNAITFSGAGNVGIGTTTPTQAKLSVMGTAAGPVGIGAGNYNWIQKNAAPVITNGPAYPSMAIGIYAEYQIVSSSVVRAPDLQAINITVSSDSRIKDIKGTSDSKKDLELLKKIKVTDYALKDRSLSPHPVIKKVIAQQVEQVYPNAVTRIQDRIPDIMESVKAMTNGAGTVDFLLTKSANLKIGEKVQVLREKCEPTIAEVTKVEGNKITVSLQNIKNGESMFIYGREVDDFRTVDYDAISMLNVSATQELASEVAILRAENTELKNLALEIHQLKNLVNDLQHNPKASETVSLTK